MKEENVNEVTESEQKQQDLGKFKSVDALMRAYNELEAEFTRRSQRLKVLEERTKEAQAPQEGQAEELPKTERGSEELYRAVMENGSVRARVLSDYLESLKGVPLLTQSGVGVTAPAYRPKSFAEAGNLALGYFKSEK